MSLSEEPRKDFRAFLCLVLMRRNRQRLEMLTGLQWVQFL